jgi:hypothetical protein
MNRPRARVVAGDSLDDEAGNKINEKQIIACKLFS